MTDSDLYFDDQDSRPYRQPLVVNLPHPTKTTWVTKDGRRIPVRKMDDRHLINTIRMLRRLGVTQMTAIPDTSEVFEIQHPTYAALLAEAEKRGLQL